MTILNFVIILSVVLGMISTSLSKRAFYSAIGTTVIIILPLRLITMHGTMNDWILLTFYSFCASLASGLIIKLFKKPSVKGNQI
jgi:hypothetical protein